MAVSSAKRTSLAAARPDVPASFCATQRDIFCRMFSPSISTPVNPAALKSTNVLPPSLTAWFSRRYARAQLRSKKLKKRRQETSVENDELANVMNNIIRVNAGGKVFHTHVSTLIWQEQGKVPTLEVEDSEPELSVATKMFLRIVLRKRQPKNENGAPVQAGKTDDAHDDIMLPQDFSVVEAGVDSDGNSRGQHELFVDVSPAGFAKVLTFLRMINHYRPPNSSPSADDVRLSPADAHAFDCCGLRDAYDDFYRDVMLASSSARALVPMSATGALGQPLAMVNSQLGEDSVLVVQLNEHMTHDQGVKLHHMTISFGSDECQIKKLVFKIRQDFNGGRAPVDTTNTTPGSLMQQSGLPAIPTAGIKLRTANGYPNNAVTESPPSPSPTFYGGRRTSAGLLSSSYWQIYQTHERSLCFISTRIANNTADLLTTSIVQRVIEHVERELSASHGGGAAKQMYPYRLVSSYITLSPDVQHTNTRMLIHNLIFRRTAPNSAVVAAQPVSASTEIVVAQSSDNAVVNETTTENDVVDQVEWASMMQPMSAGSAYRQHNLPQVGPIGPPSHHGVYESGRHVNGGSGLPKGQSPKGIWSAN